MKRILFALPVCGLLLAGCILTSVYPFYYEKDLAWDPALLGRWNNTDDTEEYWHFETKDQRAYEITLVNQGETNLLSGHLFRLDKRLYLDLCMAKDQTTGTVPCIPSHLLVRVDLTQPKLQFSALNHGYALESLRSHPETTRHLLLQPEKPSKENDARVVLTGDTGELQAYVRKQADIPEAWEKPTTLERKSN